MAISTKQISECVTRYEGLICKWSGNCATPIRHEEPSTCQAKAEHLLYMCWQVRKWCAFLVSPTIHDGLTYQEVGSNAKSLREKIMLWLSWIQAKLHSEGLLTMEQCKRDRVSPDAKFRADGGVKTTDGEIVNAATKWTMMVPVTNDDGAKQLKERTVVLQSDYLLAQARIKALEDVVREILTSGVNIEALLADEPTSVYIHPQIWAGLKEHRGHLRRAIELVNQNQEGK